MDQSKHHPGPRPLGTHGWQSKLPQWLQRNHSHWHHQLPSDCSHPLDLLEVLHQHWARGTAAGTWCLPWVQTTLSLPGSQCVRARRAQPMCMVLPSMPSLLQEQRNISSPLCQRGSRTARLPQSSADAPPLPVGVKMLKAQSVFYGLIHCCE